MRHARLTAGSKPSFSIEVKPDRIAYLREFLDEKLHQFNRSDFIESDPISVPHQFKKKQDIEIAGLIAAVLAWGQRVTIINKSKEFMQRMDNSPHEFLLHAKPNDFKNLKGFKHRTFNETDALYFAEFLAQYYRKNDSLEQAFKISSSNAHVENALIYFHRLFFSLEDFPQRTKKHIPTPERKSACKRINMYLRWMVRQDDAGVDFGIWKNISTAQLICPCDVHVERVARKLKLIRRKRMDWETAIELTSNLKRLDAHDPVKYDFVLFGLGVVEKF